MRIINMNVSTSSIQYETRLGFCDCSASSIVTLSAVLNHKVTNGLSSALSVMANYIAVVTEI